MTTVLENPYVPSQNLCQEVPSQSDDLAIKVKRLEAEVKMYEYLLEKQQRQFKQSLKQRAKNAGEINVCVREALSGILMFVANDESVQTKEDCLAAMQTLVDQTVPSGSNELTRSEAVTAFTAWLSTLPNPVSFGSSLPCSTAFNLANQFIESQDMGQPRNDYFRYIKPFPTPESSNATN